MTWNPNMEDAPSLREIARKSGVGHATVSRIYRGKDFTVSTAKKLLPYMSQCPCCGHPLPAPPQIKE